MTRASRILELIKKEYPQNDELLLEDESHQHAGRDGQESHFKLLLVTENFRDLSRVQRHRKVQALLAQEFSDGLHALTLRLLTPEEFSKQESQFESPDCVGSKK